MFNWLLNPWVTPRIQLTVLDEMLGALEVLALFALGVGITMLVMEIKSRLR